MLSNGFDMEMHWCLQLIIFTNFGLNNVMALLLLLLLLLLLSPSTDSLVTAVKVCFVTA